MPPTTPTANRQLYAAVLQSLLELPEFAVDELHGTDEDGQRIVATALIRELVRSGSLESCPSEQGERFRWVVDRKPLAIDSWITSQLSGTQLKNTPHEDRPRERLTHLGAAQLRTAELLAILIRTGRPGESALHIGEKIVNRLGTRLDLLRDMSHAELKLISAGVNQPAFCQIMAGIELGRRVAAAADTIRQRQFRINNPAQAIEYCLREFPLLAQEAKQEEFHMITLDTKNKPIAKHRITVGTLKNSLVHPREVFRPAIRDAANSILVLHNHPSGDPTPSEQDLTITKRLEEVGELIGITVIDHIIIAGANAISIQEWRAT